MKKFDIPSSRHGISLTSTNRRSPAITSSKKSILTSIVTMLLCLVAVALPHTALAYSAAGDFSASSNPTGVWSYGWSSTLGSALNLYTSNTTSYDGLGLGGWLGNLHPDGDPYVLYNGTANPITNVHSVYQPGQLVLQPGVSSEYTVVRWTAPFSGTFSISATFSGLSSLGDSVDVHILTNGTSIFDSTVFGSPNPKSYSGPQNILAGATVDFVVGYGSDALANEDNTALSALIVAVPEPGTLGLVGAGLGCLLALRFLKRK